MSEDEPSPGGRESSPTGTSTAARTKQPSRRCCTVLRRAHDSVSQGYAQWLLLRVVGWHR
ncbi:hypothetical protein AHAS_Ahas14G0224800 [Arachis hypogaea]